MAVLNQWTEGGPRPIKVNGYIVRERLMHKPEPIPKARRAGQVQRVGKYWEWQVWQHRRIIARYDTRDEAVAYAQSLPELPVRKWHVE